MLLTYVAHWWSMDGARLAYVTINNSATPVMEIPHFLGGLYPSNVIFPYPKVKMDSKQWGECQQQMNGPDDSRKLKVNGSAKWLQLILREPWMHGQTLVLLNLIAGEISETFGLLMELTVKVNVPWISWLFSVIKASQSRPECWPKDHYFHCFLYS